jgi:hypothetical protein
VDIYGINGKTSALVAEDLRIARAGMALFTAIALCHAALAAGCLNLTNGIGQPSATTGIPAIVSGCLSLLNGSVAALMRGLEWPDKGERHNVFASHFGEVVCDFNTECTLRHLQDAEYMREGDFFATRVI